MSQIFSQCRGLESWSNSCLQTTSEIGLLLTTFATKFERTDMNIHEYQGKSILKSFGVAIQNGRVADTPEAAHEAAVALAEETGTGWFVVKAQIHAGGRGKGSVTETGSHGVVLAKGLDQE